VASPVVSSPAVSSPEPKFNRHVRPDGQIQNLILAVFRKSALTPSLWSSAKSAAACRQSIVSCCVYAVGFASVDYRLFAPQRVCVKCPHVCALMQRASLAFVSISPDVVAVCLAGRTHVRQLRHKQDSHVASCGGRHVLQRLRPAQDAVGGRRQVATRAASGDSGGDETLNNKSPTKTSGNSPASS
jgi:hypothetical protein